MSTKEKTVRFRHKVVRNVACALLRPFVAVRYHNKIQKFKEQGKRPYFILYNHQTGWDQFFVGMAFKGAVYYVASEDIFSLGKVSSLIRYLVAPIPFKKSTTDVRAVKQCIRVAREGGSIAISPEGNRTYSGKTGYIRPSIVKLCRALKMPVAIVRIEGGYGVHPRWSDTIRKGTMRTYVKRVVEKEEYDGLSDEEFLSLLQQELYVDESAPSGKYLGKYRAEFLERAMYYCPHCGVGSWYSQGNTTTCLKCGTSLLYGEDKSLTATAGEFPFHDMGEWYEAQSQYMHGLDLTAFIKAPLREDTAALSSVELYKAKHLLKEDASIRLYGNRLEVEGIVMAFDDIDALSALGKNKLNAYYKGELFQIKGNKRFNPVIYLNVYYHYQNTKENEDGKFLGL